MLYNHVPPRKDRVLDLANMLHLAGGEYVQALGWKPEHPEQVQVRDVCAQRHPVHGRSHVQDRARASAMEY